MIFDLLEQYKRKRKRERKRERKRKRKRERKREDGEDGEDSGFATIFFKTINIYKHFKHLRL